MAIQQLTQQLAANTLAFLTITSSALGVTTTPQAFAQGTPQPRNKRTLAKRDEIVPPPTSLADALKLPSPDTPVDWRTFVTIDSSTLPENAKGDVQRFSDSMDRVFSTELGQKLILKLKTQVESQGTKKLPVTISRDDGINGTNFALTYQNNRITRVLLNVDVNASPENDMIYAGTDNKIHTFVLDQVIAHEFGGHAAGMNKSEDLAIELQNALTTKAHGLDLPIVAQLSAAKQEAFLQKLVEETTRPTTLQQALMLPNPETPIDWRQCFTIDSSTLQKPEDRAPQEALLVSAMDKLSQTSLGQKLLQRLQQQVQLQGSKVALHLSGQSDNKLQNNPFSVKISEDKPAYLKVTDVTINPSAVSEYKGADGKMHRHTPLQQVARIVFGHVAGLNLPKHNDISIAFENYLMGPQGLNSGTVAETAVSPKVNKERLR